MAPSALATKLRDWAGAREALWGLDFDGTLAPLNRDPSRVRLPRSAIKVLEQLALRYECAVVSGRALKDLKPLVPIAGLHLIGNHGSEVLTKEGRLWQWQSDGWQRWRDKRLEGLAELVRAHDGRLEDKIFTITIHFDEGSAARWWWTDGRIRLEALIGQEVQLLGGHLAWNLLPSGAPDKGSAAARLCQERHCRALVYFGDEATDESVFRLHDLPVFAVKVGEGQTAATHRLRNSEEVVETLALLTHPM